MESIIDDFRDVKKVKFHFNRYLHCMYQVLGSKSLEQLANREHKLV